MALQGSGQITLQDIANEFGGAAATHPLEMSEYYKAVNGPVSSVVGNGNVPTSGQVYMSNYYGGTKSGTQGGTHTSPTYNNVLNGPTRTHTYTLSTPFNPYGYGSDIQFSFGGSIQFGTLGGSWPMNRNITRTIGMQVRAKFMYNGTTKATWGYNSIHSASFSASQSASSSQNLSGNGTIGCTDTVNQVELSFYASPAPGTESVIGGNTGYCYHHETVSINPTMS